MERAGHVSLRLGIMIQAPVEKDRTHAHVREALQTRLLNWHVDTSGVPAQSRDARDMPAYIPDEPFADKEAQTVRVLDR